MNVIPLLPNLVEAVAETKVCANRKSWILIGNYITSDGKKSALEALSNKKV
jgi:hypothetical protein